MNSKLFCQNQNFKKALSFSCNQSNTLIKCMEVFKLSQNDSKLILKIVNTNPVSIFSCYNMFNANKSQFPVILTCQFHSKAMKSKKIIKEFIATNKLDKTDNNIANDFDALLKKYSHNPVQQKSLIDSFRIGNKSARTDNFIKRHIFIFFLLLLIIFAFRSTSFQVKPIKSISQLLAQMDFAMVENIEIRFKDVQGCDEVKKELQDVVEFLKNPTVFNDMGARLPKGVLMVGEPGVGKTLLAKAIAGEAGVPFFSASGSDFEEMFVGTGASRVRSLFDNARKNAPCVIFIDELDSICGKRSSSSMHPYANQTINQVLSEMDGFHVTEGIVVIGATNRFDSLDKAAIRPGRFDMHVHVHKPDYLGRIALFELYLSRISSLDRDNIDVPSLARACIGYTGADISNLVNQAAILCVLKGDSLVNMSHIWDADTKIHMGSVRSKPIDNDANKHTAYHEAGHALVSFFSPNSIYKLKTITILPRGLSGGHTGFIPNREMYYLSRAELITKIDGLLGGRAAEELISGRDGITTGVENDIVEATKLARNMVQRLSMSKKVGLQVFEEDNISPSVSAMIDNEVKDILSESYERAKALIQKYSKEWHNLAEYLLKYETLSGEDVELILRGQKPKISLEVQNNTNIDSKLKFPFDASVTKVIDYFTNSDK